MTQMTVQQIKRKRIAYLCFSAVTLLFCGLGYGFSLFVTPTIQTFSLDPSAVPFTFNILMIANCIGGISGSQILIRIGVKRDLLLSACLFLCGFLVTALFSYNNVWVLYIFYGVVYGFGSGLAYNGVIATVNLWFPDRIGFASGTQLMFFGFGTLVLGTAASTLIPILGLPTVFIIIGSAAFLLLLFGAFFLSKPPATINDQLMPSAQKQSDEPTYDPADEDSPLRSITFYVYYLLASVMGAIGITIVGSIVADAESLGIVLGVATFLVGFQSTVNGLSRVAVGLIFDKTGTTFTVAFNMIAALLAAGCVALAMNTGISAFYFVGVFCCGVFYGGFPVITTSFIRKRYGMKRYPFNLSLGNACVILGSLTNMAIMAIFGAANRGMITNAVFVLTVIAALASIYFCIRLNREMKQLDERRAAHALQQAAKED